jgi:DNA invertase Pin-like site-specific DNA recombinase
MTRVAVYVGVSTGSQTTENQERELRAVAEKAGWEIGQVYRDAGFSGAKGREARPGFDALCRMRPDANSTWWQPGRLTG